MGFRTDTRKTLGELRLAVAKLQVQADHTEAQLLELREALWPLFRLGPAEVEELVKKLKAL